MTLVGNEPTAVLYQPNAPGSQPEEGWETHTLMAQSGSDRVKKLPEVRCGAVMQRLYWANAQTAIVADEAFESQLHPELWGFLRFSTATGSKGQPEFDLENPLGGDATAEFSLDFK